MRDRPADLPARWSSSTWRAELESWLTPALADVGLRATGPLVQDRIRFWSTVLHVETDDGRVWVKENAPSQAFEAALVLEVERVAPGRMPPVVAVELDHGWLATRDIGASLGSRPEVEDEAWVELVTEWATLQRDLVPHVPELLATGLSAFPEDDAVAWAVDLADELHGLPADDPRHLSAAERAHVEAGLPAVAVAAEELGSSGLPPSLEHNDLHLENAFHADGERVRFIDLGDAVVAHPLTAFRIPLWILAEQRGLDDPVLERVVDAALEPWADLLPLADLRALLPAADRISCLHRALSWRRLVEDVPLRVVDPDRRRSYPEWLLTATDPDPFGRAARS